MGKELKVFFQDEARFGRIDDPKRCWSPAKIRPIVKRQIVREYTYAYGAICPFNGESCFLILPVMNSNCMKIMLDELASRYRNNLLLVICDGASSHKVKDIAENIIIKYLPPYSPQLNPQENIWEDMREKFFYNIAFDSMTSLENKLSDACCYYENNPSTVSSITAWNWILNC